MNPAALSIEEFSKSIRCGGEFPDVTEQAIRENLIPSGLPTNKDGTINLLEALAWLAGKV